MTNSNRFVNVRRRAGMPGDRTIRPIPAKTTQPMMKAIKGSNMVIEK
jgi:hypothetical protein